MLFNEVINVFKFPISMRLQEFQPSIEENSKCFIAHNWEVLRKFCSSEKNLHKHQPQKS